MPPRALIAIPHFFRGGLASSTHNDSGLEVSRQARARALSEMIVKLHENFGPNRLVALHPQRQCVDRPNPFSMELDIVLVTMEGDNHLIGDLQCNPRMYRWVTGAGSDPMRLGFVAHQVIGREVGAYDWYGYAEDDLIVDDPLFFAKLAYFNRLLRERGIARPLVQPNRFETVTDCETLRPVIDGRRVYPDFQMQTEPLFDGPTVEFDSLGGKCRLAPAHNPHAGCFFLDALQVREFVASEHFNNQGVRWVTWLDTAASLAIWKAFDIYKLDLDSAMTFEVRHSRPVMIRQLAQNAKGRLTWTVKDDDEPMPGAVQP